MTHPTQKWSNFFNYQKPNYYKDNYFHINTLLLTCIPHRYMTILIFFLFKKEVHCDIDPTELHNMHFSIVYDSCEN